MKLLDFWNRKVFFILSIGVTLFVLALSIVWAKALWAFVIFIPFVALGLYDVYITGHTILRNYPVLGHFRYSLESIRPEIRQYFFESDQEENPFSREKRSLVYQRAKETLDTLPFGTRRDVGRVGYTWINHSIRPVEPDRENIRVHIGTENCAQPYNASLFNISAMSFGALSRNAILALNWGAKKGDFSHNTGEGGISPYHLEFGGDLVWQIGTGYFGCRTEEGDFCPDTFRDRASLPSVKMIEIKISQGAKPGHGGILPGSKVTEEIAKIRDVPVGKDVISPPGHRAFDSPPGLLRFIATLRDLSGGKPVGFKLCVGSESEFISICKAMVKTGITPDFITVDGSEGGTGAAPLEFSNSVGFPANDGLSFVHNALIGFGLREKIRIIAAGKIITGFHLLTKLTLGADICNCARGMMFSLGCIQALKCNTNKCPSGVATQDPLLYKGLVVSDKAERVASYHSATIESALELLGAAGLSRPDQIRPCHIYQRVAPGVIKTFEEIYPLVIEGDLIEEPIPEGFARPWRESDPEKFNEDPCSLFPRDGGEILP